MHTDEAVIFKWVETGLFCSGVEVGTPFAEWCEDEDVAMRWEADEPRPPQLEDRPGRTIVVVPAQVIARDFRDD